jgi:hypothetical protein
VIWSEPHGEHLAVVTERGTVHLLEMPFSAFMWPPPRRRKTTQEAPADTNEAPATAVSLATGAFGAAYQAAKPFVSRSRRDSGGLPSGAGNIFKDSAAHGGRAIAASISNSLGKTGTAINQLRHSGENRVSLPSSTYLPASACVKWVRGRKSHTLFAIGNGLVRVFPSRTRRVQSGKRNGRSSRYNDIKVPTLPDDTVAPAIKQIIELGAQDEVLDLSDRDMDAGNTMMLKKQHPRIVAADLSLDAAIPQAEIESSAPYQPFHTDRRVTLCEYTMESALDCELTMPFSNIDMEDKPASKKNKSKSRAVNLGADAPSWAFGQDIAVKRLDLGTPHILDDDADGVYDHALPPSAMERVMEYGDHEQIVVTTRKRRNARHGDGDGDGFFEDDCEVLDFADQRV